MNPRIQRVLATEVVVPARAGHVDRPEFGDSLFDKRSKWILEVFTDNGLTGLGETCRSTSEDQVRWAARQVVGRELFSLPRNAPVPPYLESHDAYGHQNPPVPFRFHEIDLTIKELTVGVETALLDLWGKTLGQPLHVVLGGAQREWVPTSWWFGRSDAKHAARQTEIGLGHGLTSVKIKATAEDDVAGIVRAIKAAGGPEIPVVIDANGRFYRLHEALKIARSLEGFSHVMLEEPFPFQVGEWQLFRQKTDIPLVLHYHTSHFLDGLRAGCCDYVNLEYPAWRFLGDAHMAWRMGFPCWQGSGVELGILDACMLHTSAVTRNCVLPGDAIGHLIRVDDLIEETLEIRDGAIRVPPGPGLGVTLDQAALRKYMRRQVEISL